MPVMMGCQSFFYPTYLEGFPTYNTASRRWEYSRLLYHSGLDEVILYPQVPTETVSFGLDLLSVPEWAESKTLGSSIKQQWERVDDDVTVKEIFSGDLTVLESFFYDVYRHWVTLMGVNDYGLWRPLDRTDKVYRVRVINILLDGQELKLDKVGVAQPDKWLRSTVEIWLALMPSLSPSATVFATGPNS